jgi:alpha-beta hydrolase superfamily lysophospholipase
MRIVENELTNQRKQKLFTKFWLPETDMKAAIFLLHGYAEHSGRYTHVAEALTNENLGVFALDHHGHGRSEGRRADVRRFDDYADDVKLLVDKLSAEYPSLPRFVFGHSMGGAIAIKFILKFPGSVSGMLTTGAAVKISDDISPFLQKIAGFAARILPTLPAENLDASTISRDPEIVRLYENDPLVYRGKIRVRMGAELLRASKEITVNLERITIPFWAGHGTEDKLIDPMGSQWLYDRAKSSDKTFRLYNGLYHEILNEPEKETVLAEMLVWILQRC